MYISSKFKSQLSFNWHLNLIEGCATMSRFFSFEIIQWYYENSMKEMSGP